MTEEPRPAIPYGKRVAVVGGTAPLAFDGATAFEVVDRGLGRVALQSGGGRLWVNPDGAVSLRRGPAGEAGMFQWMETFDGDLMLMSLATKRCLRVEPGAGWWPRARDPGRTAGTALAFCGGSGEPVGIGDRQNGDRT